MLKIHIVDTFPYKKIKITAERNELQLVTKAVLLGRNREEQRPGQRFNFTRAAARG